MEILNGISDDPVLRKPPNEGSKALIAASITAVHVFVKYGINHGVK